MDGLGLLVVMAFIILILVIFNNESCPDCVTGEYTSLRDEGFISRDSASSTPSLGSARGEGFSNQEHSYWDSSASKPQISMPTQPTVTVPIVGPAAANLTGKKEPTGYAGISDLPSAPVANLGEVNSLPFQDPRFEKVSTQMLRQLKQDMDGFSANELPHLKDRSDPAVRLPLTRFQGDYQRVKDELAVVDRTPGFQSQLAVEDLNEMAANLRFLQRTYRLYAANEMVPAPQGGLSKVGVDSVEGFLSRTGSMIDEGFAAEDNTGCSTTPSFTNCSVLNNSYKFANAVITAYAQKIMNIKTNNFDTLDNKTKQTIVNQAGLDKFSPPWLDQEQLKEYTSNKDAYIQKIGLSMLDRTTIKNLLDKYVEMLTPTGSVSDTQVQQYYKDLEALKLNFRLSVSEYLNNKYKLNITTRDILNTPQIVIPRLIPLNDTLVSNNIIYQKYFSPSAVSASQTQPAVTATQPRPTVTGTGVKSSTTNPSNTVPPVVTSYSGDPADQPISVAELNVLRQKIAVEILRLQASGTTDPVLSARVNVFKKIQTAVEGIATQVENGSMRPQDIPIKKRDYQKFLPALGDQSAGVAGLLSKTGYPSLSSLFNAYDRGDVNGAQMTENLFQHYADILLQGMSYKLDLSYTSPNEVAARQAEATKAAADLANAGWPNPGVGHQIFAGLSGAFQTQHPMTSDGARGAFDAYTRQLDMQNFQGELSFGSQGLPDGTYSRMSVMPSSAAAANFDWKGRAQTICDNVKKMGLNPADFGCQVNPQGSAQNADFSWRGYAKMVCNRLKTVADVGVPEQVGCPPDSWRGWRT